MNSFNSNVSYITYNKCMIILNIITVLILDANVCTKFIFTGRARLTLCNIIGSVLSL